MCGGGGREGQVAPQVYLRGGHGLGQAGRQAALLRHLLLHDLQSIFIIKQYTNLMLQYKIFALITILSRHMDKIKLTKKMVQPS
jgi:hypothetical protein